MKRLIGAIAAALAAGLTLTSCGGSGGGTPPAPTPTPVPSVDACPATGSAPSAISVQTAADSLRRLPPGTQPQRFVPGQLAITYKGALGADTIDRGIGMHAVQVNDLAFRQRTLHMRIISVPAGNVAAVMARLRAVSGVRSVSLVGYRQLLTIDANDTYYVGAPGTIAPYYQTASTHGQWDMHVLNLKGAWSAFASAPVTGAPIAVVDTGADVTLPELKGGKITRAVCYVTYPSSAAQTTGPYVTDTDGHGTNVTGIADTDTGNAFGFAGVAFDAPLLVYRIFPADPSTGCEGSTSPQCSATSADEASAINDAVAHGAKVINLSLGAAPPCPTNDPEYIAVENAISHGVVVVAAAGNDSKSGLDCPAQDPGVIAVGASALNDSNPLAITEYVAGYSNYLSGKGTSAGGAYLVAPGGDACPGSSSSSCGAPDNLHWIQNLYSTTAYDAPKRSSCTGGLDDFGQTGDCNVEIAGTSMAAPHVAGVVSLMLAKNPNLTPAQISTGLCASADNINDAKQGCGRVNAASAVTWAATH